jgi:hypothetical protein
MIKTALSTLFQLFSIPILYNFSYNIALHFHEPYAFRYDMDMDFYEVKMIFLGIFVIISLSILNAIQNHVLNNEALSVILHLVWVFYIFLDTKNELATRPYTHLLVLICIGSTVISRFIFNAIFKKLERKYF